MFGHATVRSGLERSGTIAEYTVYCKTNTIPFRYGATSPTARFINTIHIFDLILPERSLGAAVDFFYRL